jgi:hypothetical protein
MSKPRRAYAMFVNKNINLTGFFPDEGDMFYVKMNEGMFSIFKRLFNM